MSDDKKKEHSLLDDDEPNKDLRWAIKEVMKKSHNNLGSMSMGEEGKFKPVLSFKLGFDSQQNQLEPIYYWLLDFVNGMGWKMEKTVDNFMASPGSGQFTEMNMKVTKMQEEGMKILGGMNQIIKSILNLVYDLKEFELRLAHYDDAKSDDPKINEAAMLALKQIWLDNVDMKKGRGAIHQMASMEMGYSTLREAFMMANSLEDIEKMNDKDGKYGGGIINDSVMRILKPRISEFLKWKDYSEVELRKRFSIEKSYLKSQVETVRLYSAWMKPYLKAAEQLRQRGFDRDAALVNAFSTTMFELQLFGKQSVGSPKNYHPKRKYFKVMIIGMVFRGHVSQRVTQKGDYGFGMGGKVDMTFDAYALNEEELRAAEELLKKEEIAESLQFSVDVAGDALKDLKDDLDKFLVSDEEKKKEDEKKKKTAKAEVQDINPFAALFGLGKKKEKKKDVGEKVILKADEIKADNFMERKMRAVAAEGAAGSLYAAYDIYKKAHRMASAPGEGFDLHDADAIDELAQGGSVGFLDIFKGRDKEL
jgi:hypothetical protein